MRMSSTAWAGFWCALVGLLCAVGADVHNYEWTTGVGVMGFMIGLYIMITDAQREVNK